MPNKAVACLQIVVVSSLLTRRAALACSLTVKCYLYRNVTACSSARCHV